MPELIGEPSEATPILTFGGLDVETAVRRASECLDEDFDIVKQYLEGVPVTEIVGSAGGSFEDVRIRINKAEIKIAHHHIQNWSPSRYGHAATLHMIKRESDLDSIQ